MHAWVKANRQFDQISQKKRRQWKAQKGRSTHGSKSSMWRHNFKELWDTDINDSFTVMGIVLSDVDIGFEVQGVQNIESGYAHCNNLLYSIPSRSRSLALTSHANLSHIQSNFIIKHFENQLVVKYTMSFQLIQPPYI